MPPHTGDVGRHHVWGCRGQPEGMSRMSKCAKVLLKAVSKVEYRMEYYLTKLVCVELNACKG